jgi:hypothetical protein
VFHIGFVVDNVDEATAEGHARGLTTLMYGRRLDRTGFTYFDTPQGAVTLEIRQSQAGEPAVPWAERKPLARWVSSRASCERVGGR